MEGVYRIKCPKCDEIFDVLITDSDEAKPADFLKGKKYGVLTESEKKAYDVI